MKENVSAKDQAINYILDEVRNGQFRPNEKIPNERKLSEQLGISRVPLREAISTLTTLGILETHRGDGTYVSDQHSDIISNVIKKYGIFDRATVDEVFEARSLFEADGAKLAARNRTDDDLKRLHEALKHHEEALPLYYAGEISEEDMMQYDGEVHLGIAASTHNHFMLQIIEAIRHVTIENQFFSKKYTLHQEHFQQSMLKHRDIVKAIEEQDENQAYQLMSEHIQEIASAIDIERIKGEETHEEL